MSVSIRAQHLSLDVPMFIQQDRETRGWGEMFLGAAFDPPRRRVARLLDNISFDVREGDRLAILGRNGAGKSTLLRVLNRVYQPTEGTLEIKGSCQAILNMALGFNVEATVRENIYLRGIAMGLKSSFLQKQSGSILEFSGLQEKANHRLRTLSAGQRMRLGFAISTSVQHDIMLMDEWVGAGDAQFMDKAKERMQSRVGGSKIVVLASHSIGLLRAICNKGIVIEKGRLIHQGDIVSALKTYHDLLAALRVNAEFVAPEPETDGLTYGCVEGITVSDGAIHLHGWCVGTNGMARRGLAVILAGLRHEAVHVEQYGRPDVMQHLGLSDDNCGFKARFEVSEIKVASDIDADFQVLAGLTSDTAAVPLRLAAAVTSTFKSAVDSGPPAVRAITRN